MNPEPEDKSEEKANERRARSKIARLPAATRERLNELLADGLTYPDVLKQLGDEARHINEIDLSRWMHNGHNLWLQQQAWIDHMSISFDAAKEIVKDNRAASIHEANLHLAATQVYQAILGCDPATLPSTVKNNPDKHVQMLQAIPQFAHQALNYQKYKEACEQAHAELQKLKDPARALTDEERRAIVAKVDEILGFK